MKQLVIKCDNCGRICEGDNFTIYRNNSGGRAIGKSDICEECYSIMLKALKEANNG